MKKKKSDPISWLNMGIFPGTICFCYQIDYDDIIKKLKATKRPNWARAIQDDRQLVTTSPYLALRRIIEWKSNGDRSIYYFLILRKKFNFADWDYVMLAHEALHLCQFHLPDVLDRDHEIEAEAYLHSHLMTQCLEILRNAHG